MRVIVWDEPSLHTDMPQLLPGEYVLPVDCVQLPEDYDKEWSDASYDNVRLAHAERLWNGFKPTEDKKVTVL